MHESRKNSCKSFSRILHTIVINIHMPNNLIGIKNSSFYCSTSSWLLLQLLLQIVVARDNCKHWNNVPNMILLVVNIILSYIPASNSSKPQVRIEWMWLCDNYCWWLIDMHKPGRCQTLHASMHKRSNLGACQRKLAGSSVMTYWSPSPEDSRKCAPV